MALVSYKDYRNNLVIIGQNKLVSIIDSNKLGIDDRYFNYYRSSYNVDEIINIIDKSFRALFLSLDLKNKHKSEDIDDEILFLNGSIESFHHFSANNFLGEKDNERIVNLIKDYTNILKKIKIEKESELIDIPDDIEDDKEIPLLSGERENIGTFKSRVNSFFQRANQIAYCIYRRVKYGVIYCANIFIENYRR
jgi:hypothetical protein